MRRPMSGFRWNTTAAIRLLSGDQTSQPLEFHDSSAPQMPGPRGIVETEQVGRPVSYAFGSGSTCRTEPTPLGRHTPIGRWLLRSCRHYDKREAEQPARS
jgi:hypothetical protein